MDYYAARRRQDKTTTTSISCTGAAPSTNAASPATRPSDILLFSNRLKTYYNRVRTVFTLRLDFYSLGILLDHGHLLVTTPAPSFIHRLVIFSSPFFPSFHLLASQLPRAIVAPTTYTSELGPLLARRPFALPTSPFTSHSFLSASLPFGMVPSLASLFLTASFTLLYCVTGRSVARPLRPTARSDSRPAFRSLTLATEGTRLLGRLYICQGRR